MGSWFDVLMLFALIVFNGVFSMSEIALVTSRRARLQVMSEDGDKRADTALKLQSDPTWALSTIQVGITSIGILSGIVGESALAKPLADFLMGFGISPETSKLIGIVTVVVLVTYFSIVFGELVPKRLGQVNPETVAVAKTYAYASGFELVEIPHKNGLADLDALEKALDDNTACVVAQSPNFFGLIEDMKAVGDKAHEKGAKFVYIFNPVSATVLVTPKECGADIAVGDGQPLGMPLAFGGPYLGILTCDSKMSRRMPGRVVGQTVDKNGKTAYVLTLQAREQHIRREKALSSICSNQALCALTAVVYLAVMGREGMRQVAEQCVSKAHYLAKRLTEVKGVKLKFDGEFFHEFAIETDKYDERLEKALAAKGILGGLRLDDGTSVWCATEKASKCALDAVADAFAEVK